MGIIPLADADKGNSALQYTWDIGYLLIGLVGDEHAAVTLTVGRCGEANHVSTLQLETADVVVERLVARQVVDVVHIIAAVG